MAKRANDEDPDYLAGTQLAIDPDSFVQAVKEAFLLEHQCLQNQDIAEVLGVDKSRVSQIFKAPKNLKAQTVLDLVSHLKRREHRWRIIRAWNQECFGLDVADRRRGLLTRGVVTEATLRRVDRFIRTNNLTRALQLSLEAKKHSIDRVQQEELLDRLFFLYQRLDAPGAAMKVAHEIAERAKAAGEGRRLAQGHAHRIRILVSLPDCRIHDVTPIFDAVDRLLQANPPQPSDASQYLLARPSGIAFLRIGCNLTLAERGMIDLDESWFKENLTELLALLKKRGKHQETAHFLVARIYGMLGDLFAAKEHIDFAYKVNEVNRVHNLETSGLLQGRILAREGNIVEACQYLDTMSGVCSSNQDYYHRRLIQFDLARVWGRRMAELL